MKRPLILDLDFTLLHLEWLPNSIEVPGRTRSAWIAPRTVELLGELQSRFNIVLATARSWDGTRWVSEGLAERGVAVSSVVIEDGALLGQPQSLEPIDAEFDVEKLRTICEAQRQTDWPHFDWQLDFKACLVARCDETSDAILLQQIFAALEWEYPKVRFYRDGRKVYVISSLADKWSALQRLLGPNAGLAAGVGDGVNDLCWLPEVALPCTFARANEKLVAAVQGKGGYVSQTDNHQGIQEILSEINRAYRVSG